MSDTPETTEIVLTPKQRQALKAQAHRLDPVVLLGAQGLTDAVMREIDRALTAHELIKVRVPVDDRDQREQVFGSVAAQLGAARVQMIGKLLVLYRPKPEEAEALPGPAATKRRPGPGSRATRDRDARDLRAPRATAKRRPLPKARPRRG